MGSSLRKVKILGFSFLITSVAVFFSATVLSMRHEPMPTASVHHQQIGANASCPQPGDADACVNYHLGLLQTLSQGIPASGVSLLAVLAMSLLGLGIVLLDRIAYASFIKLREHCRRLYEKTITAFFEQIGFWISLIEKRIPAHAFVTA